MTTLLLIILAIFLPPLAVAIKGDSRPMLLSFIINLSFYLFAMVFAVAGHPLSALFILLSIAHAIWVICTTE